jgi:ParB family chromosome partitioning protein
MTEKSENFNPKNRGLGRGLGAIFGEDESLNVSRETIDVEVVNQTTNDIIGEDLKRRVMPIEWLIPCAFQPRKYFNTDALEDLAKSIGMHGILQPIVVRPVEDAPNKYEIIAGERRWRAAQIAQLHEVPVILQYLDDATVLEIALIENLQREDLTAIEEAQALQQLIDIHGHTQEKLSVVIGKSRSYIANSLRLLSLPDSIQSMVGDGRLSAGHARSLVGKDNAEELAKKIMAENLSVRDIENLMKSSKANRLKSAIERQLLTLF